MKVAIYGQYYLNSTEPIIKDIFTFFKNNNVEMLIEASFLTMLYEREIIKNKYVDQIKKSIKTLPFKAVWAKVRYAIAINP